MATIENRPEATDDTKLNNVRPMTGDEYIESLRDDREVYIYGERVKDVTVHPAYRNSIRQIANLYDALHDPEQQGVMTVPTDTGNGGFTHPFFKTAKTTDDLVRSRDAIAHWQKKVYGWMGRTPDYKASFLGTLGANSDFYGEYKQNALNYYKRTQERVIFSNHAIVHPPIDRHLPADQIGDVMIHVEKETDNGLIISGAKVVATGSAMTNDTFIAHYGLPVKDKRFGVVFTVPTNTKGVKLFSRVSYEQKAAVLGSPFDYPLSSRYDENDAILVLDKALVPWENVFMYDAEAANNFVMASGFLPRFTFHGCTRLAVKLDFIAGCVMKAHKLKGSYGSPSAMSGMGEILNWRDNFWALSDAMAKSGEPWVGDCLQPNARYGLAYRTFMTVGYPRVKEIIEQTLGSALIYLNSSAEDFKNPESRPYLDQFVRGSGGVAAVDRVKLLKLLWDATGTEFGGRHELYERNYGGDDQAIRQQTLMYYQATGEAERLEKYAATAMDDYDLDGWTAESGMISSDDVSALPTKRG